MTGRVDVTAMSTSATPSELHESPLGDLGLVIEAVGDELHGRADILATMWYPGTESLRTSIVAAWADTILGLLAVQRLAPRVPVTLELDVHLFEEIRGTPTLHLLGRVTKAGSAVQVCSLDIHAGEGHRVGFAHSLFMAAPDPRLSMPTGSWALDRFALRRGVLRQPFAERVGCVRTGSGSAELPCTPALLNQSKTLNGGLLAVVVEEAALSTSPSPATLTSLQLRYLRPVRTGPAIARAEVQSGLGEIEVRDAETGAVAVLATTRFGAGQALGT